MIVLNRENIYDAVDFLFSGIWLLMTIRNLKSAEAYLRVDHHEGL